MRAIIVNDDSFDKQVLKSDVPTIAFFMADWSGPARMALPILEDLAYDLRGRVKVAKIDVEASPVVPEEQGVKGLPTCVFYRNGQMVASKVGAPTREILDEWLREAKFPARL
ncbi:exonuclease [Bajunvirus bajun]|uniref:Exonuclease n=1 Tax=Brevundimonas phage vB_BgoS-Bajun TaxID=2948594 RepID=A0A9E7N4V1_9CAUD|nr:exonuclease [Brevundimonas phage vB_BgoS-Bajun]